MTSLSSSSAPGVHALQFVQVDNYTTFYAEFALVDGDIVFHFFLTPEMRSNRARWRRYWLEDFPTVLEPSALKHFDTTPEAKRLEATYIEDIVDSWWMRAFGYGHLLDPHQFALGFLEQLDQGLDAVLNVR